MQHCSGIAPVELLVALCWIYCSSEFQSLWFYANAVEFKTGVYCNKYFNNDLLIVYPYLMLLSLLACL